MGQQGGPGSAVTPRAATAQKALRPGEVDVGRLTGWDNLSSLLLGLVTTLGSSATRSPRAYPTLRPQPDTP